MERHNFSDFLIEANCATMAVRRCGLWVSKI